MNKELGAGKSISRASIIMYLNRMVDEGVLGFRDATGKGGHHRIYITKLDESGYKKYIVRTLLESVSKDYPNETGEVLKSLSSERKVFESHAHKGYDKFYNQNIFAQLLKMVEERCEIKIKPDIKYGWKLEVTGCSKQLKEIKKNLGPFSNRYLDERIETKKAKGSS